VPDPTSARRRYGILAICCTSLLLVSLDNTIVNVALPQIDKDFDASVSGLQWTVDAYVLTLASLLMLSGSIADRFGRRRMFSIGLSVFVLGSALCSLAPGIGWLIAARALQAVGGSMLNPVAMSIITTTFTDPRERARAIGWWGSVFGISLALGPVVGGALTEHLGWRSIFWVNVPIGLAGLVLTRVFVPESRAETYRRLDPFGQLLVVLVLGSLIYAVIEGPGRGWSSPDILAGFVVAAVAVVTLVAVESRRRDPLIELHLFRRGPFLAAVVMGIVAFSAYSAFLFTTTLYFQDGRGFSPMHAGLLLLPLALAVMIGSPLSGRLVARFGPRPSVWIAGTCTAVGSALLWGLSAQTPIPLILVAFFLFGIGAGMVNSPITNSAVSGMPRDRAGVAAATATTSRQIGQATGVAVGGSLLAGAGVGSAIADATTPVWILCSILGVVILIVGVLRAPWRPVADESEAPVRSVRL
jgi:EmrB/QacA subfamily drug resistance transporter